MDDLPRQKLAELLTIHGRSLCEDSRRCEGLLLDSCGSRKREIHLLTSAVQKRVPADLLAAQKGRPIQALLAQLTSRLQDELGLAEDSAQWAVDSWAIALGVITSDRQANSRTQSSAPTKVAKTAESQPGQSQASSGATAVEVSTPGAAPKRRRWPYALGTIVGIAVLGWLALVRYQPSLEHKAEAESNFFYSASVGDTAAVKSFLASGMDPNTRRATSGSTALMLAANAGNTDTVKALIAGGADVNARGPDGRTTLMMTTEAGHADTAKALIAGGADVNVENKDGTTALSVARSHGYTEIVLILQQAGAKANGASPTPFPYAPYVPEPAR